MQYFGYLRRNADQAGYQFWLNAINNQLPQDQKGYQAIVVRFYYFGRVSGSLQRGPVSR
jgi:hypothetical protein